MLRFLTIISSLGAIFLWRSNCERFRYGDESKLAHLMGVMQALVSVVAQQGDQLQTVIAGDKHIVFRAFGHLILVAVGSSREPVFHLSIILKYVYNQVLITTSLCCLVTLVWLTSSLFSTDFFTVPATNLNCFNVYLVILSISLLKTTIMYSFS